MSASSVRLVCVEDGAALTSENETLRCPACQRTHEVRDGIARFVARAEDAGQAQVQEAFRFKWTRDEWGFKPEHLPPMRAFFRARFGLESDEDVARTFGGRVVLHAGIGSGQTEQYYLEHAAEVWGADISESVFAAQRNWRKHHPELAPRLRLVQADLMRLPFPDASFDVVLSDGVLHHTPDTRRALLAIAAKVKPGGLLIFYVYKRKAPIREFVDDYLRERISSRAPEEAWRSLEPLTALARDLSHAKVEIAVPQAFPLLGLEAGEFDLQRWLYWNVMKFYWNDAFTFDENNHVNYDWYYPTYAWRHSPEEVRGWLAEADLEAESFQVGESGISVVARLRRGHG